MNTQNINKYEQILHRSKKKKAKNKREYQLKLKAFWYSPNELAID